MTIRQNFTVILTNVWFVFTFVFVQLYKVDVLHLLFVVFWYIMVMANIKIHFRKWFKMNYVLNETVVKDEEGKAWDTYGITYGDIVIEDISTEKCKIEKLVSLCNELDLSPIHIHDVVDDFLVHNDI